VRDLIRRAPRDSSFFAALGLFALLLAWILSSPVMSSPDEAAHLIRGISAAEGEWRGSAVAETTTVNIATANTRSFTLPGRLAVIDRAPCYAFRPDVPASCAPTYSLGAATESSHVGTYYPLLYIPLGSAERMAGNVSDAIYAGRVASALICLFFLLISFRLSARHSWSRVAWYLAVGPLTVYLSSSAATNGIEVASSICFVCVSIALTERPPTRTLWAIWAIAGVALASAKTMGPLFVVFDLALVLSFTRSARWWVREARKRPIAFGSVAASALASGAWTVSYQRSPQASGAISYSHYASQALRGMASGVQGVFSQFGWLDAKTPGDLWIAGDLVVVVLMAVAWRRIDIVARSTLLTGTVLAGVITFGVTFVEARGGYGFQSRYTLAILAPIPLLAVSGWSADFVDRVGPRVCLTLMIALDAAALYGNGRRYAVGSHGSLFFLGDAKWIPPGGWLLVTLLAVIGLSSLALAGAMGSESSSKKREVISTH